MLNDKHDTFGYDHEGYQREMTPKDIICDANNLYKAYKDTKKSSPWKDATQKYEMQWLLEIAHLQEDLQKDEYKSGAKSTFILRERGKVRLIHGSTVRDRNMRHCLCDNVLVPLLKPKLIYDNCASLKDKGIGMSRNRLKAHLRKYYERYGTNDGYILLLDFSGYYDNIHHDKLISEVERHIKDGYVLWLVREILKTFEVDVSYMSDEEFAQAMDTKFSALEHFKIPYELKTGKKFLKKSVDIGDQCSQILGIYFPTRIDNLIKIVYGEKFDARYMDDSYIISDSKERLIKLRDTLIEKAKEMGIIINLKKTMICKLSTQFTFLQHRYFLTKSGKVVEKINPKRVTAMRRKLKKLHKKLMEGKVKFSAIEMSFNSWMGSHYKVMSKRQRKNMNDLYNSLYADYLKVN